MAVRFDPTVNLGHVLSAGTFLLAALMGYATLEKRVSIQDMQLVQLQQQAADRQREQREALSEIKGDVKDVQRSINTLTNAISAPAAAQPQPYRRHP